MTPTQITITFSKRVSDGNYGHEGVDVFVAADLAENDDPTDVGESLGRRARDIAFQTLSQSPSLAIRRSLQPQEPRQAREDEL